MVQYVNRTFNIKSNKIQFEPKEKLNWNTFFNTRKLFTVYRRAFESELKIFCAAELWTFQSIFLNSQQSPFIPKTIILKRLKITDMNCGGGVVLWRRSIFLRQSAKPIRRNVVKRTFATFWSKIRKLQHLRCVGIPSNYRIVSPVNIGSVIPIILEGWNSQTRRRRFSINIENRRFAWKLLEFLLTRFFFAPRKYIARYA